MGSIVSRNDPPTFVPDLILRKVNQVDDLSHLSDVARLDPLGNYITYGMANEALRDGFKLVDEEGNEIMQEVQREIEILRAVDVMILALAYERTYGWSYIYTGKNRYVPSAPEGGRLAKLYAFTPEECVVKQYTAVGDPLSMELTVHVGEGEGQIREKKIILPAEDFIFFNTRPIGRGYQGMSALEPVWDMLTYIRRLYWSMCFYDMKIGHGLFAVMTEGGIQDEYITKLEASLQDIGTQTSWIIDGTKIKEAKYIGAGAGATDFDTHINACLKLVAAGTGVAMDVLVGASAGTISGSDVNQKSSFKEVSEIQGSTEPVWEEIIKRMGFDNGDYGFLWNARYAHDEEEQAKIDFAHAQTQQIKLDWMTINEVRAEEGLPPTEGGDKLKAEFQINVDGLGGPGQSPEEQENTGNEGGTQI
jgi:hypothetical protein